MKENRDYEITSEQFFRLMVRTGPQPDRSGKYMAFFCMGDETKRYLIKWFRIGTMDLENLTKNRYLRVI